MAERAVRYSNRQHADQRMKTPERDDISRFLVHLTRDFGGKTAEQNLLSMLKSRSIKARNPHCLFQHKFQQFNFTDVLKKKFNSVCFTEVPFTQLQYLTAPIPGRRIELKPYGLVFRKADMLTRGASPAIYVNAKGTAIRDFLLKQFASHFQARRRFKEFSAAFKDDANSIIDYYALVNVISDTHDFSWEREWRLVGDMSFSLSELFAVVVPEPDAFMDLCRAKLHAKVVKELDHIPMVSPAWNAERIIEVLSVKLWACQ